MARKYEYKGYLFKVTFFGDAITPTYNFDMYKKSKFLWFDRWEKIWRENFHREEIINVENSLDKVIDKYNSNHEKWKLKGWYEWTLLLKELLPYGQRILLKI